jgi:hypothetical protein
MKMIKTATNIINNNLLLSLKTAGGAAEIELIEQLVKKLHIHTMVDWCGITKSHIKWAGGSKLLSKYPFIYCGYLCIHVSVYPCIRVSMYPCIHVYVYPCIRVFVHSCIHVFMIYV